MLKKILALLALLYAAASFAAVDVNKASAADLDAVKGVGPAISQKIVDERKKGTYKDWDDLVTRVKGIGEKSAVKLSEGGLTVNGQSYKGTSASASSKKDAKADKAAKDDKGSAKMDETKAKKAAKDDKAAESSKPVASSAKMAASAKK